MKSLLKKIIEILLWFIFAMFIISLIAGGAEQTSEPTDSQIITVSNESISC